MNNRAPFVIKVFAVSVMMLCAKAIVSPLNAQSDATERISDVRARTAIRQTLKNTSDKRIPIDPLVSKMREGLSKGSDDTHIEVAVRKLAKHLEASSAALTPVLSVEELNAGAEALQAGVPPQTLREMRKIWTGRPLTLPLGILQQLVSSSVPVSLATKRVRELMVRGANDKQLATLQTNVAADVTAGLAPDAALELRAKGVLSFLATSGTASSAPTVGPAKTPIRPK